MSSQPPQGARLTLVRLLARARLLGAGLSGGEAVVGHHNRNLILPVGGPLARLLGLESGQVPAKFRVPLRTVEVVPRLWPESAVLSAVGERLDDVPRCLADFGSWSLHDYVPGRVLAEETPKGPVGDVRLAAFADFFARLVSVPADALPTPPADWPRSPDTTAFLCRLARFAEERVHLANRPRFGALFDRVGIPHDAVERFLTTPRALLPRPFCLLHTDVHRGNVVVDRTPLGERLSVVDWELALYGDPLHDLATHLVRMDYDDTERRVLTDLWADSLTAAGHARMTAGLDRDLGAYLDFEYVQSLFPDVMRAALALPDEPADGDFRQGAERVHRALCRAWGPLGRTDEPIGEQQAEAALRAWHADHGPGAGSRPPSHPDTATSPGPPAPGPAPAPRGAVRRTAAGAGA
ncbi:phosphotransferase family protein [Streptomyces sp. bgisy154]|uniref:phosphotransferase family protein n=1 Tax=Streptomyces sp. bgisy154 TaxID=3413794 RepID=UPI003D71F5C5